MDLEGSAVGTLRPGGAECACMHLVRPLADTPCRQAFPLCGRTRVSLLVLCLVLRTGGGTAQTTWDLRVRAPIPTARVSDSASVRPCAVSDALRLLPPVMFPRVRPA